MTSRRYRAKDPVFDCFSGPISNSPSYHNNPHLHSPSTMLSRSSQKTAQVIIPDGISFFGALALTSCSLLQTLLRAAKPASRCVAGPSMATRCEQLPCISLQTTVAETNGLVNSDGHRPARHLQANQVWWQVHRYLDSWYANLFPRAGANPINNGNLQVMVSVPKFRRLSSRSSRRTMCRSNGSRSMCRVWRPAASTRRSFSGNLLLP